MGTYFKNIKNSFKWKHSINYFIIFGVLVLFIILNACGILGKADRSTLTRIGFSMILAVSLNLVVGFLGELSLGHAGFMCVGAYIGCFVNGALSNVMGNSLPNLLISMLVGGAVAGVFGLIIGIPSLRLKGDYLAITTLAFGEIVRNVFKNLPSFGGAMGMDVKLYDSQSLYIVTFILLIIVLFFCQNLYRSKHGRAITAIRDNEIAAKAMGVNVTYYKLFVFAMAAFFAGMAGVLYGKCIGTIRQETFSYNYSIEILVMVVLGGIGSMNGSMIAAAIITYINIVLQNALSGSLAPLKLIVYALILILMILFNNAPAFAPAKRAVTGFFAKLRHKITKPKASDVRDDGTDWTKIPTKIKMDEILTVDVTDTNDNEADIQEHEKEV